MSFRFGIFENPNITSPLPPPRPPVTLSSSFSPNGHLASHINPFRFPRTPLDQKTEEDEEDEESGRRRDFGRERKREKERGGGGEISKWSDDEYE
jgi:hypothetical protein